MSHLSWLNWIDVLCWLKAKEVCQVCNDANVRDVHAFTLAHTQYHYLIFNPCLSLDAESAELWTCYLKYTAEFSQENETYCDWREYLDGIKSLTETYILTIKLWLALFF